mmetsp:Transcript_2911/g.6717  ORF Transcript_2911/g.6717 Transcript_2911/m.6717 type:complete len:231 (+) Transcript_2911:676-1368(+)
MTVQCVEVEEERVPDNTWQIDLRTKLPHQAIRHASQRLDLGLAEPEPPRGETGLTEVGKDRVRKLRRHVPLRDVPPYAGLLLLLLAADLAQVGHQRADGSQAGREGTQPQHQHDEAVQALLHVCWVHLHGGRGELGERPMQRRQVVVHWVIGAVHPGLHPPLLVVREVVAYCPPAACNYVIDDQHERYHLCNLEADEHALGTDKVRQLVNDAGYLDHPQHANDASYARDA